LVPDENMYEVAEWISLRLVTSLTVTRRVRLLSARLGCAHIESDLLVLDDLFLSRTIPDAAGALLQTLIHLRYKLHRSVVVTPNRVVQDWGAYLGDNTMSTTISTGSCITATSLSSTVEATASRKPLKRLRGNRNPAK
jgi:hypothetical protein